MLQMGTVNPCKKMGCSHMCVLAPGPRAVCKCPPGLLLAEDDLNCSNLVNSAFLLLLSLSSVTQVFAKRLNFTQCNLHWQNMLYMDMQLKCLINWNNLLWVETFKVGIGF